MKILIKLIMPTQKQRGQTPYECASLSIHLSPARTGIGAKIEL